MKTKILLAKTFQCVCKDIEDRNMSNNNTTVHIVVRVKKVVVTTILFAVTALA